MHLEYVRVRTAEARSPTALECLCSLVVRIVIEAALVLVLEAAVAVELVVVLTSVRLTVTVMGNFVDLVDIVWYSELSHSADYNVTDSDSDFD